MVYQKMAIMTKPRQILKCIVFSIFVDVMNRKCSRICHFTQTTNFRHLMPIKYASIGIHPCCKIRMFFSNIQLIAPTCLTAFTTEEKITLRFKKLFLFFIGQLSTNETRHILPFPHPHILASRRTIFPKPFLNPKRFCIKIFPTSVACDYRHSYILHL